MPVDAAAMTERGHIDNEDIVVHRGTVNGLVLAAGAQSRMVAKPLCNTWPVSPFRLSTSANLPEDAVLSLYESVGWQAYTGNPELLCRAIRSSSFVVTAWGEDSQLIGLARTISDDATICYLQDILVRPSLQGIGVGRALFTKVAERYQHVRQTVLITDDQPQQRAFYESMGLTEGSHFAPEPVRVFARFR